MPTPLIRIGILGLHHDHVWTVLDEIAEIDGMEAVAAADPHVELREKFSGKTACPVYVDPQELLDREGGLDAVFLYGDNRSGSRLAIEAMDRGLHAMVEKPMAANAADADLMLKAAERNGVRLMINWPFAWWYQLQHALRLCLEGDIGTLWMVKYRAAHEGIVRMGHSRYFADWAEDRERSGGGAMTDYCCYGALLAKVLLGMPESVSGLWGNFFRPDLDVEDNAVISLKYPRAMAVAEASWTQHGKLGSYTPIIYGETGSILVEPRNGGRLFRADLNQPKGVEIPVPEPEEHLRGTCRHFRWILENPQASLFSLCDPRHCRDGNAITDAGAESASGDSRLVPPRAAEGSRGQPFSG
ncbi:MAG: Gfo/Idh/MocA family oxidoreductase [Verrucomicrobiales bacterium]